MKKEHRATEIILGAEEGRERARSVIEAGGVIAFRTDTFYGLGADPFNRGAVARINKLKEREGLKPVLLLISEREVAERFCAERSQLYEKLTEHYWPGPLTVVCRARADVPPEITAGSQTIGLRLPSDDEVRALVRVCGGALTATSANSSGQPPARTALEVAAYFPNELDLIIDGGQSRTDKPSTVIDASRGRVSLIREGEIARSDLTHTLRALEIELE